jgi:hypothetical protein
MENSELSETEILEHQIRQLKEAVAVMENRNAGSPGIKPDEMWSSMKQKMDDKTPMHPRIIGIFNGHVDLDQVKKTLKRLENDLNDLENVDDSHKMYDPMEHEIDNNNGKKFDHHTKNQDDDAPEDLNPASLRDKNQRPLSAYQNSSEK